MRVSSRTIQKAVNVVTGKKFRILKGEFLLKKVKILGFLLKNSVSVLNADHSRRKCERDLLS